jgi:hypothetical protein
MRVCPFCAGSARMRVEDATSDWPACAYVLCNECGARGPLVSGAMFASRRTGDLPHAYEQACKELALLKWESR